MQTQTDNGELSLFQQAAGLFAVHPYPSISAIERHLRPGYRAAAECMEQLEAAGIVSKIKQDGTRDYLGDKAEGRKAFEEMARKLKASMEPAGRWWEALPDVHQRDYSIQIGAKWQPWGDMSDAQRQAIRKLYRAKLTDYLSLARQFRGHELAGGVA